MIVRLVLRVLRAVAFGCAATLGSLCAVSIVTYASYGPPFRKTVRAATVFAAVFSGIAFAIRRLGRA